MANGAFSDIEFKANAGQFNIDQAQGIVECFVAGIGNKDSVGDVLVSGAFKESLKRRKPRVVWGHNWNDPIGKVLEIYEVPPNDPRLPMKMKTAGIGGLYARVQFNLGSEKGREAFANVAFFGEEQEWSIGYKTLVANFDPNLQANILREVELYEVSPVLHGANQLTGTISVKSDGSDTLLADSEKCPPGMPTGMPMHQGPKPMGVRPQAPAVMPKPASQKPVMEDPITVALRRELTKRTGSTVVVREVEDGMVIFDRFTSDGQSSTYRVRFGMDDGEFAFGKPERVIARTTYMPANQERSNVVVPSQMPGMPMMVKPGSGYELDYEKSAQIDSELETLEGLLSESVEEKVGRKINKRNLEKLKSIMEMLHEAIGQAEDVIGAAEKDIDTKSELFVPVERDQLFHTKSMLDPILDYHRVESYVSEKGIHFSSGITPEFVEAIDTATKALGRKIRGVGRAVTATFDPNAIDADNDMIVQEGTPFERPGLPNIPGGKPGMRSGKISSAKRKDILKRRASGEKLEDVAKRTGVSREEIRQIESRLLADGRNNWKTNEEFQDFLLNYRESSKRPLDEVAKLLGMSREDVRQAESRALIRRRGGEVKKPGDIPENVKKDILKSRASGESLESVSKRTGISREMIRQVEIRDNAAKRGMRSERGKDTTFILSRNQVEEISNDLERIRKFSDDKDTIDEIQDRLTGSPMFPGKDGSFQELILDSEEMSRLEAALQSGIDNSNKENKPGIASSETLSLLGNVEEGGTYDGLKMTGMRSGKSSRKRSMANSEPGSYSDEESRARYLAELKEIVPGRGRHYSYVPGDDEYTVLEEEALKAEKLANELLPDSNHRFYLGDIADLIGGYLKADRERGERAELVLTDDMRDAVLSALTAVLDAEAKDAAKKNRRPRFVTSDLYDVLDSLEPGKEKISLNAREDGSADLPTVLGYGKPTGKGMQSRKDYGLGNRQRDVINEVKKAIAEADTDFGSQTAMFDYVKRKTGHSREDFLDAMDWMNGFKHGRLEADIRESDRQIASKVEDAISEAFAPGRKLEQIDPILEEMMVGQAGRSPEWDKTYKGPFIDTETIKTGDVVRLKDGSQGIVTSKVDPDPERANFDDNKDGRIYVLWTSGPRAEEIGNGPETGYEGEETLDAVDVAELTVDSDDMEMYRGTDKTKEIAQLSQRKNSAKRELMYLGKKPNRADFADTPMTQGLESRRGGKKEGRTVSILSDLAKMAADSLLDAKTKDGTITRKQRDFIRNNVIARIGTSRGFKSVRGDMPEPRRIKINSGTGKEISTFLRGLQKDIGNNGSLWGGGQNIDSDWIDNVIDGMKKGDIATNDLEAIKDLLLDDIRDIIRNKDDKSALKSQQELTKKVRRLFIGSFSDEEQAQIRRGMGMGATPELAEGSSQRARGFRSEKPFPKRDGWNLVERYEEATREQSQIFIKIAKELYDKGFLDAEVATIFGTDDINAVKLAKGSQGLRSTRGISPRRPGAQSTWFRQWQRGADVDTMQKELDDLLKSRLNRVKQIKTNNMDSIESDLNLLDDENDSIEGYLGFVESLNEEFTRNAARADFAMNAFKEARNDEVKARKIIDDTENNDAREIQMAKDDLADALARKKAARQMMDQAKIEIDNSESGLSEDLARYANAALKRHAQDIDAHLQTVPENQRNDVANFVRKPYDVEMDSADRYEQEITSEFDDMVRSIGSDGMASRKGGKGRRGDYEPTEEDLADYGKYLESQPKPTKAELEQEYQDWLKKNGGLSGLQSQKKPNVPEDRKKFVRDWAAKNRNFEIVRQILGKEERGEKLSEGDYKALDTLYRRFGDTSPRGFRSGRRNENETPVDTVYGERSVGRQMGGQQLGERDKGTKFEDVKPDNWDEMDDEQKLDWMFNNAQNLNIRRVDRDRINAEINRSIDRRETRRLSPAERRQRIAQMREEDSPGWQRRRAAQQEAQREPGSVVVTKRPDNPEDARKQRVKDGETVKRFAGVTLDKAKNSKKLPEGHSAAWEEIYSTLEDENLTRNQIKEAMRLIRKLQDDSKDEEQNDALTGSMQRADKLLKTLSQLDKYYKKDKFIEDGPDLTPDTTQSGNRDIADLTGGDDDYIPDSVKRSISKEAKDYLSSADGFRSQTKRPERAEIVAEATWFKEIERSLPKEIDDARKNGDTATTTALTTLQRIMSRQESGKTGDKRTNVGTLKLNQDEADSILDAIMVIIDRQGDIGGDKRQQMFAQLIDKIATASLNTFMGGMPE